MNRMQEISEVVRESITEALLTLMNNKNFSEITITELVKKAGVGRASFYRNFASKEEVILKYMYSLSNAWWEEQTKKEIDNWQFTFSLFEVLKPTVLLLYKSNMPHLFYEFLEEITQSNSTQNQSDAYKRSMITGLYFGIFNHWIRSGMKENTEELSHIFKSVNIF